MSTVMKSDVVGSEIDAPRFETRSSEDSRASRTVDKLESKLKEQLKNFDARNIDVIDPNLDDRFQTEVKLYDTDGSLDLSKVVDRSKQVSFSIKTRLKSKLIRFQTCVSSKPPLLPSSHQLRRTQSEITKLHVSHASSHSNSFLLTWFPISRSAPT